VTAGDASALDRPKEVRAVADALREVIDRFVATSAPLPVFEGIADDLLEIATRLGEYPQGNLYLGFAEAANAGEFLGTFDNSPLMGRSNPLAPPMHLHFTDNGAAGTVTFGSAYEGPPGHVHGGYVAAAFDELLGMAQSVSGRMGMTGRLTVHYRKPTPLRTELRLESTVDSVNGRKIVCTGRLFAGDDLCAEAEGLFIAIDPERFEALRALRDSRQQNN
jgi:acyl-coenzyme A thioesterase PaaI-like protein